MTRTSGACGEQEEGIREKERTIRREERRRRNQGRCDAEGEAIAEARKGGSGWWVWEKILNTRTF